jgi:ABC-type uncharacterized transport system permease subunit
MLGFEVSIVMLGIVGERDVQETGLLCVSFLGSLSLIVNIAVAFGALHLLACLTTSNVNCVS